MITEILRFGPHTALVLAHLNWISAETLLRFRSLPVGPFLVIRDFEEARRLAQRRSPAGVSWTNIRDSADAALYEVGLLDTQLWLPFKTEIKNLLYLVSDRVTKAISREYLDAIDDVIADLHVCALCLAINGKLDPFHDVIGQAYECGGWPCGCTGPGPQLPTLEFNTRDQRLFLYWNGHPETAS